MSLLQIVGLKRSRRYIESQKHVLKIYPNSGEILILETVNKYLDNFWLPNLVIRGKNQLRMGNEVKIKINIVYKKGNLMPFITFGLYIVLLVINTQ